MDDLIGIVVEEFAETAVEVGADAASDRRSGAGCAVLGVLLAAVGIGTLVWLYIVW
ncbi:MAG: hypothetical protein Q7T01_01755 [bacterium]|nr:hypothetical protein [bacterium]